MKRIFTSALLILIFAYSTTKAQQTLRLYDGPAPGSENWSQQESEFTYPAIPGLLVRNVTNPTLTVFKPKNPNGTAVIVCPGGGFHWLSYQSEGTEVAEWLTNRGITAFVLKYRLVNTGPDIEDFEEAFQELMSIISTTQTVETVNGEGEASTTEFSEEMYNVMRLSTADGIRAVEYVRQHAAEFSVDPEKIGLIGFSAGSGVEMEVILNGESASMPNFAAHIYGGDTRGHEIPENAPPLFILSAADDNIAASNPDLFRQWRAAGKSAELHIYSEGGHGFGMEKQKMPTDSWIDRFGDWLHHLEFME